MKLLFDTLYFRCQFIWLPALFITLHMLVACDSEESLSEMTDSSVIICLKTCDRATRAEDYSASPDEENEMICSWWVAFVDKNGIVAAVAESGDDLSPCMEDDVECQLPAGSYTAYAFANISQEELKDNAGIEFKLEGKAPGKDDILKARCRSIANGFERNLPMSGYKDIKVENTIQERFSIEMVRMLAKVEFSITNKSSKTINVKSIKFGTLHKGDIPLMPDYLNLVPSGSGKAPILLEGVDTEEYTHEVTGLSLGIDERDRTHFYVRESVAESHPTGHYHFSLGISRDGKDEEFLYALTDNLTYINRNDYILIPVSLHDYSFKPEVLFYPPIGGYPPVVSEDKNDEYYIKFGTGGFFEITPRVYENGDTELARGSYTVALGVISGADIFTKAPSLDETTGEITGELSSSTGTAVILIIVTVKEDKNNLTFTRNLYIIRE